MGEFLAARMKALLAPGVQTPQVRRSIPKSASKAARILITIKIETDRPRAAAVALDDGQHIPQDRGQPAGGGGLKLSTLAAERTNSPPIVMRNSKR